MIVYTDGSYNKKFSPSTTAYAAIIVTKETDEEYIVDILFGVQKERLWVNMWNVGGEICAVEFAIDYIKEKYKPSNIDLYFDYIGIEKWVSGEWKAKNAVTASYKNYMEEIKKEISVTFNHVPGHSNILLNEVADKYAKYATELYLKEGKDIYLYENKHIPKK